MNAWILGNVGHRASIPRSDGSFVQGIEHIRGEEDPMKPVTSCGVRVIAVAVLGVAPVVAAPFFFSTGNPDGVMATLSRTASPGKVQPGRGAAEPRTATGSGSITTTSP
jgi:hypothetical protein